MKHILKQTKKGFWEEVISSCKVDGHKWLDPVSCDKFHKQHPYQCWIMKCYSCHIINHVAELQVWEQGQLLKLLEGAVG